jgi:hypothetical protein
MNGEMKEEKKYFFSLPTPIASKQICVICSELMSPVFTHSKSGKINEKTYLTYFPHLYVGD